MAAIFFFSKHPNFVMDVWNLSNPKWKKAFPSWEKVFKACSCSCLAVSWVPVLLSVNLGLSLFLWLSPEESSYFGIFFLLLTPILGIFLLTYREETSLTLIVEPLEVAYTLVFLPSCIPVTGVVLFSTLRSGAYHGVNPCKQAPQHHQGNGLRPKSGGKQDTGPELTPVSLWY